MSGHHLNSLQQFQDLGELSLKEAWGKAMNGASKALAQPPVPPMAPTPGRSPICFAADDANDEVGRLGNDPRVISL